MTAKRPGERVFGQVSNAPRPVTKCKNLPSKLFPHPNVQTVVQHTRVSVGRPQLRKFVQQSPFVPSMNRATSRLLQAQADHVNVPPLCALAPSAKPIRGVLTPTTIFFLLQQRN